MQRPNLDKMWEAFIKMSWEDIRSGRHINILRFKISPMVSLLKNNGAINWYCFLIHDRSSGVPTTEDDNNPYFHIRFALQKDADHDGFLISLPKYCVMGRKTVPENLESIAGIDKSLLKNEEIEEAWRIIGEQSDWLLNMLNIHKEDVDIPAEQVEQFLHFYSNMTGLSKMAVVRVKCPYCKHDFLFQKDIFFMRQ